MGIPRISGFGKPFGLKATISHAGGFDVVGWFAFLRTSSALLVQPKGWAEPDLNEVHPEAWVGVKARILVPVSGLRSGGDLSAGDVEGGEQGSEPVRPSPRSSLVGHRHGAEGQKQDDSPRPINSEPNPLGINDGGH